jgi:hypothetical protein
VRTLAGLAILVCLVLVAACGRANRAEDDLANPALEDAPPPPALIVTYTRSGGIAGRHEVLHITGDGDLHLAIRGIERRHIQVEPARLQRLRMFVTSAEFRALDESHVVPGWDLITYTVTVELEDGQKTVETTDGAPWPPPLRRALRELDSLRAVVITRGERVQD